MSYNALSVAKYVIARCNDQGYTISNLKLQKIMYFIQAQFLVATGEKCFPEVIEAWDFGPVVPVVYHRYKAYGSASIPYVGENYICPFTSRDRKMVDSMIEKCGKYSAATLVDITHRQTPWKKAYRPYYNAEITSESIKDFFGR